MARPQRPESNAPVLPRGEEFDIEADLAIDPDFLDAEFLNHPAVFMRYARESAKANKAAKQAEETVKLVRSELTNMANIDPDACLGKGVKPTVTAVEAFYRQHEDHKKAKEVWVEACYMADLLSNAVFAFQARKSALENLVRLHGQNYFSTPQEPRDLPESAERLRELKESSVEKRVLRRTNGR